MISDSPKKICLQEFLSIDIKPYIEEGMKLRREKHSPLESYDLQPLVIVGPSGVGKGTLIK
jgi:ABC-type lipoprotein export system ATPase subunit